MKITPAPAPALYQVLNATFIKRVENGVKADPRLIEDTLIMANKKAASKISSCFKCINKST